MHQGGGVVAVVNTLWREEGAEGRKGSGEEEEGWSCRTPTTNTGSNDTWTRAFNAYARRGSYLPRVSVEARIIIRIYADLCVDHLSSLFIRRCGSIVAA